MLSVDMPRRPPPPALPLLVGHVPHVPTRPKAKSKAGPSTPLITRVDPERRGQSAVIRVQRRTGGYIYEYSIRKIALGSGLSPAAVTRILAGQRSGKIQTLEKIATYLGLSLDSLNHYLASQRPASKP